MNSLGQSLPSTSKTLGPADAHEEMSNCATFLNAQNDPHEHSALSIDPALPVISSMSAIHQNPGCRQTGSRITNIQKQSLAMNLGHRLCFEAIIFAEATSGRRCELPYSYVATKKNRQAQLIGLRKN